MVNVLAIAPSPNGEQAHSRAPHGSASAVNAHVASYTETYLFMPGFIYIFSTLDIDLDQEVLNDPSARGLTGLASIALGI